MEHFIRIAFWIVTLSACYQAKSVPRYKFISSLQKEVQCTNLSTFYAPTNVEPKCITTALDCFKKEIDGTVTEECQHTTTQPIYQAIDYLDNEITESAKDYALTDSTECACEAHPQLPFSEFLDKMESLLQYQGAMKKLG